MTGIMEKINNKTMNELELSVTKKKGDTYRVNEITERRGERSRVFRMSDGSEQAEYCFAPIHVYNLSLIHIWFEYISVPAL